MGKCALESCVYWTWVFGHTEPTATSLVLLVLYHQIVFGGGALKALESLQCVPYAQIPIVQYTQTDTIRQTDGPLVPMVRLVPIENDVIPMVLLVNVHLIKGT